MEAEEIRVHRGASGLVFQGEVEKVWEEAIGSMKITKKKYVEEKMKVAIPDIEGIDILDGAGRSR